MRRSCVQKVVLKNEDGNIENDKHFQSPPFRIGRRVESIELCVGENEERTYIVDWEDREMGDEQKTIDGAPDSSKSFQSEFKIHSKTEPVTPILSSTEQRKESKLDLRSSPLRYMGVNIAKKFDTGVFVGRVTDVYDDEAENATTLAAEICDEVVYYHIAYEDGDSEDVNHEELKEGIALFSGLPKQRRLKYEKNANIVTPPRPTNLATTSSFQPLYSKTTPIHTLILGTHPGRNSLNENRYFAFPTNAFWWIAGDCLGFRRDLGEKINGDLMKLCADLRYDESHIIPYQDQVSILCQHGFALWDIIASCNRQGSLDRAIQNDRPNDIRAFVREHPTIKNIVFANGKSALSVFDRHFKEWWQSGTLVLKDTGGYSSHSARNYPSDETGVIECICASSVSPAAATMTYKEKRDFWDRFVYTPGLKLHRQLSTKQIVPSTRNSNDRTTTFSANILLDYSLLNKGGRIGMYLPEARKHRIARFHVKRQMRVWRKRIEYDVSKQFADSRPSRKGQFVEECHMAMDLIEL